MYEPNQSNTHPHDMSAHQVERGGAKKFIAVMLTAIVIVGGGYVLVKKNGSHAVPKSGVAGTAPAGSSISPDEQKKQIADVMASVGKLMLLPKGDEPVLARVEDPDALVKQQAFFAGAEKGDALLIFPKTQRAILYSLNRNLIINSGPIIAGDQSGQNAQSQAPAAPETTTLTPGQSAEKKK